MAKEKKFALSADQLRSLAEGYGGCFASDRITVDGQPIGFMYREEAEFDEDSGWRFLAGDETQEYIDDADNLGIYDVNTIANYDPDIIPLLDSPADAAFERDPETGEFVEIDVEDAEDEEGDEEFEEAEGDEEDEN